MDNNYGPPLPATSEDGKPPQGVNVKEELGKELPSPDSLKQVRLENSLVSPLLIAK